jgi:parvulin-like peptidyl-prolyl isomerase
MDEQLVQQEQSTATNAAATPTANPLKGLAIGAGAAIAFAVIVTFSVFMFGIYRLGWYNTAAVKFSQIVPLSAAKVNDQKVPLDEYLQVISGIHRLYTEETAGQNPEEIRAFDEIREQIYLDLIDRRLSDVLVQKYGITVTDEEVDAAYTSGQEQLTDIASLGWTDQEMKDLLIKPSLLQQKTAEAVAADTSLKEEVKKQIEDIKAKLDAGGDFAELAKEFSEDGSAADGGDLGYFGTGVMVQEFEDAAFALNAGETSGIIETEFGFHIIKVDEVEKKDGATERVHARHILLRTPDNETELHKLRESGEIQKYIKFPAVE